MTHPVAGTLLRGADISSRAAPPLIGRCATRNTRFVQRQPDVGLEIS